MNRFRVILLMLIVLYGSAVYASENEKKGFDYKPELYGTLRTRYEWATDNGDQRFQVRTARVGLTGHLLPILDYKVEVDLCDRGKMKFLDVWGRVAIGSALKVQLGNMRLPFTMGSARGPHQYRFADRPVTDKELGSPRNVGAKLIISPRRIPLTVEGGVFNALSNTRQDEWQQRMSAAAKATLHVSNLTLQIGTQSLAPDSVRMNNASFAASWSDSRWLVEGEYVLRHYAGDRFDDVHGWNVMLDYGMPVKTEYFNRVSFQGRWDGITDYSNGEKMDAAGKLAVTQYAHNRLTVGTTLSYIHEKVRCDLRLNYEHFLYAHDVRPSLNERNKLVAELVVRF